tara:strand:+ start:672 stop:1103 length:432 start_codon:yes stop_codon:yes gene_type:complete
MEAHKYGEFLMDFLSIIKHLLGLGIIETCTPSEFRRACKDVDPNYNVLVFNSEWDLSILEHLFPIMSVHDLGLAEENFDMKGLDTYTGATPPDGIFFSFEDEYDREVLSAKFFPREKYVVGGVTMKDYRPLVKFMWKPFVLED